MNARLTPIENPRNPIMKLAYWLTKRKVGKVISPMKIQYARLPISFSLWVNKISSLEKQLPIPEELALLIKIHVAQLNDCGFCIDIGKAQSIEKFKHTEKFFRVREFEESSLFSAQEKLALRFATELTLHKKVSEGTFAFCREAFSDEALVGIAWSVSTENYYNLMNRAFEIESDGLCAIKAPVNSGESMQHQLQ